MAEHDYVIANQNGANTRSDLNNALAAIVSNNSKASAPTTTYAYMWWADTANDILKQRNGADSAWISILTLSTGAPLATIANFTSTGIDDNATSTAITIDSAEHVSLAHGIGFNGDTAAANALDDYETGTFTPALPVAATYSGRSGKYTKIGNTVTFNIYIEWTATPAISDLYVSGLPFTPVEQTSFSIFSHAFVVPSNFAYWNTQTSGTNLYLRHAPTTGNNTVTPVALNDSGTLYLSGTYRTA